MTPTKTSVVLSQICSDELKKLSSRASERYRITMLLIYYPSSIHCNVIKLENLLVNNEFIVSKLLA